MDFDRTLPLKERILKRRKLKRIRIYAIIAIALACCNGVLAIRGGLFNNDEITEGNSRSIQIQSVDEAVDKTVPSNLNPMITENNKTEDNNIKDNNKVAASTGLDALKKDLEKYISGFTGTYGIYYINLSDGSQLGINDKQEYLAASTVKLPLNLYLFKMIQQGNVKRDGVLTYKKEDFEEGTGELRYAEIGTQYSIHELSKLSIQSSDNVATNILFRFLEKDKVKKYMESCGGTMVKKEENVSCPSDMALYMKLTYEFCQQEKVLGKELMGYLQNTEYNDRIPALLPKDMKVAHKTGNMDGFVHDIGVILSEKPYILALMSKNTDENQANMVLANISKKVYDYQICVK